MKTLSFIVILSGFAFGCTMKKSNSEIFLKERDNIINVSDRISAISTDPAVWFGRSWVYILDDYLIVCDVQMDDKGIHLFDKNTFEYVTSTGIRGRGPGEIVRYGLIGVDNRNRSFYMMDLGQRHVYKFQLDSVLVDENYKPEIAFNATEKLSPSEFGIYQDSIILGTGLEVASNNTYNETIVKCNINSGSIESIGVPHPEISATELTTYFALSEKKGIYVQGFLKYDLLTIRTISGEPICNVYGPDWQVKKTKSSYYGVTRMTDSIIFASFRGTPSMAYDQNVRLKTLFPTKLVLFDTEGRYLKTLETEHDIFYFCIDEENNRIIAYFQDLDNPLAYIDLNGII